MSKTVSEVLPDIHHKMSKKIAQLTKVIYMLNTKNEDHQAEVDAMTTNHQLEIQEILRDAAARINKFKDSIDVRQSQVNQDAMLEKLHKKYEAEKLTAIQELQTFKSRTKESQDVLTREYQGKFDALRSEVDVMNTRFKEKIVAFESINKTLRGSLDETKRSSTTGMSELKKKYDLEMEEHVRTSNNKYQSMLLDQLRIQEELRVEMARAVENAKKEAQDRVKAESEKLVGQLRAQLSGDKQESLMLLRREWEDKLQSQKEDLSGKLEKAISDIRIKDEEVKTVRQAKETAITALQQQLKDLQLSSETQSKHFSMQIRGLEDTLEQFRIEAAKLKTQCVEGQEEITRQEQLISDKNTKIHELEVTLLRHKDEIAGLTLDLQNARMSGAASASDLQGKVSGMEREMSVLRNELAQGTSALTNALNEVASLQTAAQKAVVLAEKAAAVAAKEREKLLQQLGEAEASSKSTGDRAADELAVQRKLMAEREETCRREVAEKELSARRALDALKEQHRLALEAATGEKGSLESQFQLREQRLREEMETMKVTADDRFAALSAEHRRVEDDLISLHKVEMEQMKQLMAQITSQLQDVTNRADGDKNTLRSDMSRLETLSRELQSDLDTKVRENERVESVCSGLKVQVESLRDELKASQKALRDKMQASLAQSEADWAAKMEALTAKYEQTLAVEAVGKQTALKSLQDELTRRHAEELAALKMKMQQDSSGYAENSMKMASDRHRLEVELREAIAERQRQVRDLGDQHAIEVRQMEEQRSKDLEAFRAELSMSMSRKEADAQAANAAAAEAQRMDAEKRLREALARAAADQESALSLAEKNKVAAVSEAERRMREEKATALAALESAHKGTMADARAEKDKSTAILMQELEGLRKALEVSEKGIRDGQSLLAAERQERARREEAYLLGRDQTLREHESDLRKERERHDALLKETVERSAAEARTTRQEFKDERGRWEETAKAMQGEIARLEKRIRDRESRAEDLVRIQALSDELEEKEASLQKTREEMLYFKRELVNREENYNKKFNASPNVGIMQVLKPKDADTSSGGAKKPPRQPNNISSSASTGALGMSIGKSSR